MKINRMIFIQYVLLGINAFLALPVILSTTKKDKSILSIALFFAILGYFYSPPLNDLTRLMDAYEVFDAKNISPYMLRDYFLPALFIIGHVFDLNAHFLGFTAAFILYYFLAKMAIYVLEKEQITGKSYYIYLILYFSFIPFSYYSGIRFTTALSLFLYGIFLYYYKNKKQGYLYLALAPFAHYTLWIGVFIFLLYNLVIKKIKTKYFWMLLPFLSFVIGQFPDLFLARILEFADSISFLAENQINVKGYFVGHWGVAYLSNATLIGMLVYKTRIFIIISIIMLYVMYNYSSKNSLVKFTIFISSFVLLLPEFRTLFDRFSYISLFFILITSTNKSFLIQNSNKVNNIMFLFILFVAYNIFFTIKEMWSVFLSSYGEFYRISGFNMLIDFFRGWNVY